MKVYVAGKWERRLQVRGIMRHLREHGHHITFDWTHAVDDNGETAAADVQGVRDAEALVILAPMDDGFRGTYVEMGIAVQREIPIIVIGTGLDACIFVKLPQVQIVPDPAAAEDALRFL